MPIGDWEKWLPGVAGGLFGLYSARTANDNIDKPVGYQGGIPTYQFVREQVPDVPALGRRPGAGGQRYFSDSAFVPTDQEEQTRNDLYEQALGLRQLNYDRAGLTPPPLTATGPTGRIGALGRNRGLDYSAMQPDPSAPQTYTPDDPSQVQFFPDGIVYVPGQGFLDFSTTEGVLNYLAQQQGTTPSPGTPGEPPTTRELVSPSVFQQYLQRARENNQSPQQIYENQQPLLLEGRDLNRDGFVSPTEYFQWEEENNGLPFASVDLDNSGTITQNEIDAWRQGRRDAEGQTTPPPAPPTNTGQTDTPPTNTGQTDTPPVSQAVLDMYRQRARENNQDIWQIFRNQQPLLEEGRDLNRDGFVSPTEYFRWEEDNRGLPFSSVDRDNNRIITQNEIDAWRERRRALRDPLVILGQRPAGDPTIQSFAHGGIATLGRYMGGHGDGMRDSVPAAIDGQEPAALSNGEFVIPADIVSHLGNGNSEAGAKALYAMMAKVRRDKTGRTTQGQAINPMSYMP